MVYLLSVFWAWLLLALLGGAIVGWVTSGPSGKRAFGGWLPYGLLAFVVAIAVALSRLLTDWPALWLETGLLFASSYLLGCCLGSALGAVRRQTETIASASVAADTSQIAPVKPPPADEPETSPPVANEEKHAGTRPRGLVNPRGGNADDLKLIRGIGPQNEERLHALGIWHFAQIAGWTADEVRWVGSYLAFPGRIEREDWRGQAAQFAQGVGDPIKTRKQRNGDKRTKT